MFFGVGCYAGDVKRTKFGRYELLHKLAAGGMAEIFLARQWGQAGFFRDVVIKRLFPHFAENERALRMFQDEARLLAELSHPNIPQVFDLGYADGYWYLAMEHVGGFSLADVCRAAAKINKPMPLIVAVSIVSQICAALHHAHERLDREGRALRIVHRDVTPHNVMITGDGVIKVLDFGVAQTAARVDTDAGVVRGTYAYMAPEQVRGRTLDKRADVFALGVILYELTTGKRLYRGTDVQVMTSIVEHDVTAPRSLLPNYPAELESIVLKALQRDRGARTPSTAHFGLALDQFLLRAKMIGAPLVISRYVRELFPYERAHEAGMGIAETERSEGTPEVELPKAEGDFDERQLVEELRRLGRAPSSEVRVASDRPRPLRMPRDNDGDDSGELRLEEQDLVELGEDRSRSSAPPDRLGLDSYDDDAEVRPVVLLSPKRKAPEPRSEGDFMKELQRRLEEDGDNSSG